MLKKRSRALRKTLKLQIADAFVWEKEKRKGRGVWTLITSLELGSILVLTRITAAVMLVALRRKTVPEVSKHVCRRIGAFYQL